MMTTYFFPDCRLEVSAEGESLSLFPSSGRVLKRIPRPVDDKISARLLGYGSDALRFRREHDVLLHTLAVLQGRGCSPLLWSLAHEDEEGILGDEARQDEEDLATHVHRWLNLDLWHPAIEVLLFCGWDEGELRNFLRAVLEGEITHISLPVLALAA